MPAIGGLEYGDVEVNYLSPLYNPEAIEERSRKPERRLFYGDWAALEANFGWFRRLFHGPKI
jgi:hypothetical protein